MGHRRHKLPKYFPGIIARAPRTPGVFAIEVRHDDWCDLIRGKGECNCNPKVQAPKRITPFINDHRTS